MDPTRSEIGTEGPALILVGVGAAETSLRAAAYAAGLARRQGASLIVVYVKPSSLVYVAIPEVLPAMQNAQDQIADELRDQLDEHAMRIGVNAEFVVREGNICAELLRVAEERKVDAIVIGASTRAAHRLIGSPASKLVRHASRPITVVP